MWFAIFIHFRHWCLYGLSLSFSVNQTWRNMRNYCWRIRQISAIVRCLSKRCFMVAHDITNYTEKFGHQPWKWYLSIHTVKEVLPIIKISKLGLFWQNIDMTELFPALFGGIVNMLSLTKLVTYEISTPLLPGYSADKNRNSGELRKCS